MLPPEVHISSRESPNCSRATRKRFFNQKEFGADVGYLSRSFRNSIIDDGIIKDLTFSNSVCNSLEAGKQKRRWCTNEISSNKKKEKDLNRGTPEHLADLRCVDINGDSLFRWNHFFGQKKIM
ncbi:UNVERIFIED_CONTAM: hypothetical protein Sindi_3036000 [Sesamum indicum]